MKHFFVAIGFFSVWCVTEIIFFSISCFAANLPSELRKSIFKVSVVSQEPNYQSPWIQGEPVSGTGSGFYIGDGRIVTNAHVVARARYITVQRDGDSEPRRARLLFIAHDSDLAILTVDRADFFDKMKALKLGGVPKLHTSVATVGYPRGGEQISITEGVTSRISYQKYVHDGASHHLLIQVDSAINPGNSGGPVMQGSAVVGVAFQAYSKAENTGYMIPIPVLKRFLADIKDGSYEGHPLIGARIWRWSVSNEGARKWYGLNDGDIGVKLSSFAPWSPLKKYLQAGDIILAVDGNEVGVDGRIQLFGERVDLRVLYDLKLHGETLGFRVLRNRKEINVDVTVDPEGPHYSQEVSYGLHPKFLVFSGLVFTELSVNLLRSWGSKWYQKSPLYLRYLHFNSVWDSEFLDREGFVVLTRVLAHSSTSWFSRHKYGAVDELNGQRVVSFKHFVELLDEGIGEIRMTFLDGLQPILLDKAQAKAFHGEILEKYHVPFERWMSDIDGAKAAMLNEE